ncbi:MAG: hypothetical protein K2X42_03465, partial [Burkholderiaceae bacterium]|nr:hypothetical protein [Burkholderiaceae bacterium]
MKTFLRAECQRIYLSSGVHLQLEKQGDSYIDVHGNYHTKIRRHIRVDVALNQSPLPVHSLTSPPRTPSSPLRCSFSPPPMLVASANCYNYEHDDFDRGSYFHAAGDDLPPATSPSPREDNGDTNSFHSAPQESFGESEDTTSLFMPMPVSHSK